MSTDIETLLCPNRDKLIKNEEGFYTAEIVDVELDIIKCSFNGGCVEINTEDLSYIILDAANLKTLLRLIEEAEDNIY
jgi:hypothetical protein